MSGRCSCSCTSARCRCDCPPSISMAFRVVATPGTCSSPSPSAMLTAPATRPLASVIGGWAVAIQVRGDHIVDNPLQACSGDNERAASEMRAAESGDDDSPSKHKDNAGTGTTADVFVEEKAGEGQCLRVAHDQLCRLSSGSLRRGTTRRMRRGTNLAAPGGTSRHQCARAVRGRTSQHRQLSGSTTDGEQTTDACCSRG